MSLGQFNEKTEKPEFIYKRNPDNERSFIILRFMLETGNYEDVGDYTVIDDSEDIDFSEKKLGNIIRLLNGKEDITDLSNLTEKRLLFNIIPKENSEDPTKLEFRTKDKEGTSEENAVLTLKKGVLNEQDTSTEP